MVRERQCLAVQPPRSTWTEVAASRFAASFQPTSEGSTASTLVTAAG
ncbi:hypothetical protein ACFQ1I_17460 [Kitasatospora arboriphila]